MNLQAPTKSEKQGALTCSQWLRRHRLRAVVGYLSELDYVYVWVDGIHFSVRLGSDDRLCVLVMVGVRTDGTKELVAISEGYRESSESWAEWHRKGPGGAGCGST